MHPVGGHGNGPDPPSNDTDLVGVTPTMTTANVVAITNRRTALEMLISIFDILLVLF